jgi:hypothetical protein
MTCDVRNPDLAWDRHTNVAELYRLINGQSRETSNIGYTRRRKTKEKHNTISVGHYFSK